MTEEIIIDGINVAGCERRIGKNNFCRYFKRNCADNNYNCIWKKCLRLEQENKELKKIIRKSADSFCKDYLQTFKENEELKEKYESLDKNRMEILFNAQQEIEFLKEDNTLYLQALEEIREIAKSVSSFTACDEKKLEKIQNKINEVLGDENSL